MCSVFQVFAFSSHSLFWHLLFSLLSCARAFRQLKRYSNPVIRAWVNWNRVKFPNVCFPKKKKSSTLVFYMFTFSFSYCNIKSACPSITRLKEHQTALFKEIQIHLIDDRSNKLDILLILTHYLWLKINNHWGNCTFFPRKAMFRLRCAKKKKRE